MWLRLHIGQVMKASHNSECCITYNSIFKDSIAIAGISIQWHCMSVHWHGSELGEDTGTETGLNSLFFNSFVTMSQKGTAWLFHVRARDTAWPIHVGAVTELTMQVSCVKGKPNMMVVAQRSTPKVVGGHLSIIWIRRNNWRLHDVVSFTFLSWCWKPNIITYGTQQTLNRTFRTLGQIAPEHSNAVGGYKFPKQSD